MKSIFSPDIIIFSCSKHCPLGSVSVFSHYIAKISILETAVYLHFCSRESFGVFLRLQLHTITSSRAKRDLPISHQLRRISYRLLQVQHKALLWLGAPCRPQGCFYFAVGPFGTQSSSYTTRGARYSLLGVSLVLPCRHVLIASTSLVRPSALPAIPRARKPCSITGHSILPGKMSRRKID